MWFYEPGTIGATCTQSFHCACHSSSGSIPAALWGLSTLELLGLHNNQLTGEYCRDDAKKHCVPDLSSFAKELCSPRCVGAERYPKRIVAHTHEEGG